MSHGSVSVNKNDTNSQDPEDLHIDTSDISPIKVISKNNISSAKVPYFHTNIRVTQTKKKGFKPILPKPVTKYNTRAGGRKTKNYNDVFKSPSKVRVNN